jgi:hypothetical protein
MVDAATESRSKPKKSKKGKTTIISAEEYEELSRVQLEMPAPSGRYDKSAKARRLRNMGAADEDSSPVEEDQNKPEPKDKLRSARKKEKGKKKEGEKVDGGGSDEWEPPDSTSAPKEALRQNSSLALTDSTSAPKDAPRQDCILALPDSTSKPNKDALRQNSILALPDSTSASKDALRLDCISAVSDSTSAPDKDTLRKDCISALRKLCDQGSISPKQKRVLLTDIITCAAKGEVSMVEVAYELLSGEGEDKDASEEFADQCQVFALSLSPGSSPSQQQ